MLFVAVEQKKNKKKSLIPLRFLCAGEICGNTLFRTSLEPKGI